MIDKLLTQTKKIYSFPIQYSKDCETLSHAIFNRTNCSVSPTTLKRLFGFAKVKDKPSKFTLNTLSAYCGYVDWTDFIANGVNKSASKTKSLSKWEELKSNSKTTSNYTLEALKSNSGLGYNQTIKRKFVYSFIDEFLESKALATCLIANGGMGKSISIAQVVDDYWLSNSPKYKDDIIWFISGTNLRALFAKQLDLDSWFLELFSLTKGVDYRNYFSNNPKQRKGRILLIIDALDELVIKSDDLDDLFRKLIELIGSNTDTPWFKVILTTRTSTFERLIHIIKDYPGITKHFYGVNFDNLIGSSSNVPLLSEEEILQIIGIINSKPEFVSSNIDFASLNPSLRLQIAHPYYLQLFIQSFIDKTNDIHSNYDILNEFMAHRIYKGKYGFEKTEIFNALLANTDYGRKATNTKKSEIADLVNQYNRAYKELLSFGILKESYISNKFKVYIAFIQFAHDMLFEFLIAKHWIMEFQTFSHELLLNVAKSYSGKEKRIDIIKHIALMGLEEGKFDELQHIYELQLEEYELNRLSHVLGIQIRENKDAQKILVPLWAKNKAAQIYFFERFVDLDNLNGYYGDAISIYLKNKKSKEAQIFGNCLLFMKAFLSKDELLFRTTVNKLSEFSFDLAIHPFPLGRQMACHIIAYRKFHQRRLGDNIKNQILRIAKSVAHKKDFVTGFPAGYHFHVIEGLFFIDQYDLIITLFESIEVDFPEIEDYKQTWLYKMLQIYYSAALKMVGRKVAGINLFKTVNFEQVFKDVPWYKNYFLIQYLKAKHIIVTDTKEKTAVRKQIETLSDKLGFSFS